MMTQHLSASGPGKNEIQAHRGASAVAPENTIAGFKAASEQGAQWVELDVALLGDGTADVIHDVTIDRCSSSKGHLKDMTVADLSGIDAGSWFGERFKGERIPLLGDVVTELGRLGLNVNVEIKQHPHHTSLTQLTKTVHEHLQSRAAHTQVMISSFDPDALRAMHALDANYDLAMLWSKLPEDWADRLAAVPAQTIHLLYKSLSIGFLEDAASRGIKVRAWTCNDPRQLMSFWPAGLTGVITDDPSLYLK
jgi:glycerophosphoryl diester phosphodiesterase